MFAPTHGDSDHYYGIRKLLDPDILRWRAVGDAAPVTRDTDRRKLFV